MNRYGRNRAQLLGGTAPALRGGASMSALVVGLCIVAGCSQPSGSGHVAKREFQQFQRDVYPVLLRDCAFSTCHGDPSRFFRVFGPGRRRMPSIDDTAPALPGGASSSVTPEAFDLPSVDEIATSYSLALSMIDDTDPGHSRLLLKPLAAAAGGSGHNGVDKYGRDVYRTAQDSGYVALARWVFSASPQAKP